jgi:hypothetical protein
MAVPEPPHPGGTIMPVAASLGPMAMVGALVLFAIHSESNFFVIASSNEFCAHAGRAYRAHIAIATTAIYLADFVVIKLYKKQVVIGYANLIIIRTVWYFSSA